MMGYVWATWNVYLCLVSLVLRLPYWTNTLHVKLFAIANVSYCTTGELSKCIHPVSS